jgi:hypothetical protein
LGEVLGEPHPPQVHQQALKLLQFGVQLPESRPGHPQILQAVCPHTANPNSDVQNEALLLIQKLGTPLEIWQCLFDSLAIVDDRNAYRIIQTMLKFTSPAQAERTGATILDKFMWTPTETSSPAVLAQALAVLNYRQAIPRLQELVRGNDREKIVYAANLLGQWQDKDSIPLLRKHIDATHQQASSSTHLRVLQALYQLEGSAGADYIVQILLHSSLDTQRSMAWQLGALQDVPGVIGALCKLAQATTDAVLKKNLGAFLQGKAC